MIDGVLPAALSRRSVRAARLLLFWSFFIGLGTLCGGHASAHDGQNAAIDVEPSHVVAGGTLVVLGSDFASNSAVELRLRTAEGDIVIATAMSGADGHFVADVALTRDLALRAYELLAVSGTTSVTSLLTVTAAPGSRRPGIAAAGAAVLAIGLAALWRVRQTRRVRHS